MNRLPCSVIVTAGGNRKSLRICLSALRPTVRLGDEVVCVVPPDRDDLRAELRGARWLTVLDEAPEGQAERWSAGLAVTTHPVVVFLDGDVCVSAHWLDPVRSVFADPDVVAAGPRCHFSYGPQAVDLPKDARDGVAAFQRYARAWRQEHRGEAVDVDRLGPVCVALRRSALDRAGGPTAELPYESLRSQGRIVRVDGAVVTHLDEDRCALRPPVETGTPLLSASLIVRDEEDVLADCLDSLAGFVDEIVVYDTGSTDRTRDIAREYGARVVEGSWDNHFGDARNRSLSFCRGTWVLAIDADEVLEVDDRSTARAAIQSTTAAALAVTLDNMHHDEAKGTARFQVVRMFRRDRGRWAGRLHEQIVDPVTGRHPPLGDLAGITLTHWGYTHTRVLTKDKRARNARLAELALSDNASAWQTYYNLATSYASAGNPEGAVDACRAALTSGATGPVQIRVLKVLISALLSGRRLAEANAALEDLRRIKQAPVTVVLMESRIRYQENQLDAALTLVQALPTAANEDKFEVIGRDQVADVEIGCLRRLGRHAEAVDRLREVVRAGRLPVKLALAADVLQEAGSGVGEIADLLPPARLRGILYAVNEAPETVADELLEALWARDRDKSVLLALGARVAPRLPLMRALEWSWRLRQHGLARNCSLVALAGDLARTPRDRTLAAAVALEMFADQEALPLLSAALADVPAEQNDLVLTELAALAPGVAAAVEPAGIGT